MGSVHFVPMEDADFPVLLREPLAGTVTIVTVGGRPAVQVGPVPPGMRLTYKEIGERIRAIRARVCAGPESASDLINEGRRR